MSRRGQAVERREHAEEIYGVFPNGDTIPSPTPPVMTWLINGLNVLFFAFKLPRSQAQPEHPRTLEEAHKLRLGVSQQRNSRGPSEAHDSKPAAHQRRTTERPSGARNASQDRSVCCRGESPNASVTAYRSLRHNKSILPSAGQTPDSPDSFRRRSPGDCSDHSSRRSPR